MRNEMFVQSRKASANVSGFSASADSKNGTEKLASANTYKSWGCESDGDIRLPLREAWSRTLLPPPLIIERRYSGKGIKPFLLSTKDIIDKFALYLKG